MQFNMPHLKLEPATLENQPPATTLHTCQGLISSTPVWAKSATLRVTTLNPCSSAVAAIMASRSERGLGTCNAAHTGAVNCVNGKMRPAKAARTPVSQARNALPCGGTRRSSAKMPISSSSRVIADKNNLLLACPAAQARKSYRRRHCRRF